MEGGTEYIPTLNSKENTESVPTLNSKENTESVPTLNLKENTESVPTLNLKENTESVPTLNLASDGSEEDVEIHLEMINKAIGEINLLSKDFLVARGQFIAAYEENKAALAKKYGANKKNIDKARPFYLAREHAYRAKYEHRKSAVRFKKACEEMEQARDVIRRLEEVLLMAASGGNGGTCDPEILISLNEANKRVEEAARERALAEDEQRKCMVDLSRADGHLANSAQVLSKYVLKASSYFDERDKMQRHLDSQYYKLWQKSKRLQEVKERHKEMFTDFSSVSSELSKLQMSSTDDFRSGAPPDLSKFQEVDDNDIANLEVSRTETT